MLYAGGLDLLVVMPARVSPHKPAPVAREADRLELARLNFADLPRVEVSDLELVRPGKSFTIETVRALHSAHPDWELFLVMGLDALLDLPTWYQAEALAQETRFLACLRPPLEAGASLDLLPPLFRERSQLIELPQIEIKASLIRERVAAGAPYAAFLHPAVYNHIEKQHLYGAR